MEKKIKKGLSKPLIQHIENAQLALGQWAFALTYSAGEFALRVCTPQVSIIEHSPTSKKELVQLVIAWLKNVGKLLIWLGVVGGIVISLLSLLMPAVVLYVVELVLVWSLKGPTYLLTKLLEVVTKLKTNILKLFSKRKD